MSLTIVPFEQSAGSLIAGLYCTLGSKGDAATIVKKANTVLAIGSALAELGTGDIGAASSAILAAISSNPNLDPAVALAVHNALLIVFAQWQAAQAFTSQLPFISPTVEALISAFAAGLVAGANAELAKYSAPAPGTAPAAS